MYPVVLHDSEKHQASGANPMGEGLSMKLDMDKNVDKLGLLFIRYKFFMIAPFFNQKSNHPLFSEKNLRIPFLLQKVSAQPISFKNTLFHLFLKQPFT